MWVTMKLCHLYKIEKTEDYVSSYPHLGLQNKVLLFHFEELLLMLST